jgi:hypothetical protein
MSKEIIKRVPVDYLKNNLKNLGKILRTKEKGLKICKLNY